MFEMVAQNLRVTPQNVGPKTAYFWVTLGLQRDSRLKREYLLNETSY